ncbi:strigolactone esterase RMS3-like [Neltuma alba]|uniref:strigolactone esterase RMS3-like n=1 Tax=Neltuma alba TaxID=207710 RepID=UPI0010A54345|nr:strigolactone esterase RMS3-like [Prosopis alba]
MALPCSLLACYFKILVFDLAFSPNLNPPVYDPTKYASLDGHAQDLTSLQLQQHYIHWSFHVCCDWMLSCNEESTALSTSNPAWRFFKQNYSGWAHSFAPIAVGVNDPNAIVQFESNLGRMKPEVALSVAETVFLSDIRWVLPRVLVPCPIIQCQKDDIVPNSVAFYMKSKLGVHASDFRDTRSSSSAHSSLVIVESSQEICQQRDRNRKEAYSKFD